MIKVKAMINSKAIVIKPRQSYYVLILNLDTFQDREFALSNTLNLLDMHIKIFHWMIIWENHVIIITESNYDLPYNIDALSVFKNAVKVKIKCMGKELFKQISSCMNNIYIR
jgi:hypothetical protein